MKKLELSDTDATQIASILRTHAMMQDMRAMEPMELIASMKKNNPNDPEADEMIKMLGGQIEDMELDSVNLSRIADLIEAA